MIGKVFFARVAGPDVTFSAVDHAREDLVVLKVAVSQARQEAAIIELETLYPAGGLLGGDRYGILSADVNGTIVEIARGEIVGFPVALAGETVRVELICRRSDHAQLVDDLFATRSDEVPPEIEDINSPRRAEGYILDEVYHDRRTLTPTLEPISGQGAPAAVLYGEGAAAGQSEILSMSIEITDAPARSVMIEADVNFTEVAWGKVDLGSQLTIMVPDADRATYTPNALANAVRGITLDGGYELLASSLETQESTRLTVHSKAQRTDPATCAIIPSEKTHFRKHIITDLKIEALVTASQPRSEILRVSVEPSLAPFGGEVSETEYLSLGDCETRARTIHSFTYFPTQTSSISMSRLGVGRSIFASGGQFRSSCRDIYDALIKRAARIAIERAHCVRLTVETTAEVVLGLDLRDRVEVRDVRLPGGVATGKIVGWDIEINNAAIGRLVLAVPISGRRGSNDAAAVSDAAPVFRTAVNGATTAAMSAVRNSTDAYFVERLEIIDAAPEQEAALAGSTATSPIEEPDKQLPRSGIAISLADLSPTELESLRKTELETVAVSVTLPDGISL